MDQRKALIKLIKHCTSCEECRDEDIADYLLANGVTFPPCKVGDTVYQTDGVRIYPSTIQKVIYDTGVIAFDETAIGKSIFRTEKEAMRNQNNKLSWSEFKGTLDDGKISAADLKAMYEAYIDDSATE